ncbi:unnamed protein product [Cylicostephanus goldi]|uniref:Uncharacterized protein n=1 Tax=Cylicostephanus goldi TaxID=71465 RepID=A0A3P6UJH5_CYLGO|nr:unnamed protein product [Cylicostephanus goldi]
MYDFSGTTATKTYIYEKNSESSRKNKVRIISLRGTTRFFLNVVAHAGVDENFADVYGICRQTKYCDDVHCRVDDDNVAISSEVILPATSVKIPVGETL